MTATEKWQRFRQYVCHIQSLGLTLDISRMAFDDGFFARTEEDMRWAFQQMERLERGAISNPDEQRMVGHYWLRDAERAPTPAIAAEIRNAVAQVQSFAKRVHEGEVKPPQAERFTRVLLIGIGGSALGPMFVADALGNPGSDRMQINFIDNTDPDGIERTLALLEGQLAETLCIVTSKSGGTPETRNGMILAADAYGRAGLRFPDHAVAITKFDTDLKLYALAKQAAWLEVFPMWDWVGGRTSETSAVGLLPAALQGLDIDALLDGAKACDEATRGRDTMRNPAALLALMWLHATGGKGAKDMVVLPYKDRLQLFSRYLQQLVMESLGKKFDLAHHVVHQGITVYGNKGSTDQHAYVQQLRDGVDNFFVTFIRVLESGGSSLPVRKGVTAGDYLHGLLTGTRDALSDAGRQSMTITIPRVDAQSVGALSLYSNAPWVLRLACRDQCLSPAGRGGRKESGGARAGASVRDRSSPVRHAANGGAVCSGLRDRRCGTGLLDSGASGSERTCETRVWRRPRLGVVHALDGVAVPLKRHLRRWLTLRRSRGLCGASPLGLPGALWTRFGPALWRRFGTPPKMAAAGQKPWPHFAASSSMLAARRRP